MARAIKRVKKNRCTGKTADGKKCKRKVAVPRKRCYQHR